MAKRSSKTVNTSNENVPESVTVEPRKRGRAISPETIETADAIETFIGKTDGWVKRAAVMHNLELSQNQWLRGITTLMNNGRVVRQGNKKAAEYEVPANLDMSVYGVVE